MFYWPVGTVTAGNMLWFRHDFKITIQVKGRRWKSTL